MKIDCNTISLTPPAVLSSESSSLTALLPVPSPDKGGGGLQPC